MKNVSYKTEKAGGGASPQAAAPRRLLLKRLFALLFALSLGMQWAYAYDFTNSSGGKTFYYNIIDPSNRYVEVTYPNTSSDPWGGYTKPTGYWTLLSAAIYQGQTYTVTRIGSYAFNNCTDLTGVTIPEGVTEVNSSAFSGCTGLTSVTINSNAVASAEYTSDNNLKSRFGAQVTSYTLGSQVTAIGQYAFHSCTGMTQLTINGNVTSIGNNAFRGCTGLTSVTLPNSVTTIGTSAFYGCSGLASVNIPTSATSIGAWAFNGTSIASAAIPSGVTTLGNNAFSNCNNLTSVTINSNAVASDEYTNSSVSTPRNFKSIFGAQVTSYTFGANVTAIGKYALYECSNMTQLTINGNVTSIGERAIFKCTGLTSVSLPNSITTIGTSAFYGCSGLASVNIPTSATSIGAWAFNGTSIASAAIPSGVTTLGNNAFSNCNNLTSVTINSNAVASDEYTNSSVSIPRNFKSIFGAQVTSYTFGANVTAIGKYALYECSGIQYLFVKATTPPTVAAANTFSSVPTHIPVYVPSGSQQAYRTAEHWSRFTNIIGDPANDTPVSIPFTQDFNSTSNGSLPTGWHSLNGSSYVYNQQLRMSGGGATEVVLLPTVTGTNYPCIEMKYKSGSSSNDWEIGYVTDIYDPSTFVSKCTPQWANAEWNTVVMRLSLPAGARYALRTNNTIFIDDVKLFNASAMPNNTEMAYVQYFSENGTLPEGWLPINGRAINNSGYLKIIGNEFVLLPKLTASAQRRRVMEVDVKIINTGNSTAATVDVGYMPGMEYYYSSEFQSKAQLECPANATRKKRLYVYTDLNQATRRFAIKTSGNATVQVDDVQVYYTYESPEQNDFICDFSNNPINTTTVPNAGAYSYLVGQPNGNLYTDHNATNNWKTGTVNGVSDKHAYCDIASSTQAVSSWLVMPFVKVTENERLLSYNIAVTHKNGTQQQANPALANDAQFLKVYISEDGYNWTLEKTYSGSTLANIPPTGEEVGYIRLSSYYGKNIKVAFQAGCNAGVDNNYRVHIDNVTHSNYDSYPPYNVQATNVGLTSATISWQYLLPYQSGGYVYVPADGTSAPPAGNTISDVWSTIYNTGFVGTATNVNQLEVTGLLKGKQYTAYVCSGDVEPLMWESTTFTTASNGAVPTNLSVEVQGRFAVATWDAGAALDWEYVLKRKKPDNTYETVNENVTYGSNLQHFIGLEAGEYSFEVRAEYENTDHSAYYSDYTTVYFTIVDDGSPLYHKPEFTLKDINDVNKLTLAWTSDLPHPKATQYLEVDFCTNEEFYIASEGPSNEHKSFDVSTESIRQFTNEDFIYINEGNEFYVRLRVVYSFFGSSSDPINSETLKVTMPVQCAAVTNIAEEVTENAINLTWEGSAVSYEVRYRPEGSSDDYNTVVTETNSVSIDDFMPHTSYEASIIATCEYGLTSEPVSFMFNHIQFEDTNVKSICVNNWDTNGDEELSYGEAAAVVNLGETFYENGDIVTFNELRYFTGLSDLSGDYFAECPKLTSIVIPASVTSITCSPFRNSSALESITVDAGNTKFASPDNCNAIINTTTNELVAGCKNTVIPYGVVKIGNEAFWGCTSLTSIDIPASVTTIGNKAFNNCSGLTTLTLPASVTQIIDGAFWGCTGLVSMTVEATTPPMITESHDPFSTAVANNIVVYVPCGSLEAYLNEESGWHYLNLIENCIQFEDDNVKDICVANWDTNGDGELSYYEAANVTDISGIFTFNEEITSFNELQYFTGLTEINANAFEDCTNLASVTLPESITSIENWAFSGCESLTGILIPEGVTNIIVGAFYYSGLESIVIPASVTQIGSESFSYCTNLQSITVANDNPNYTSNDGCNVIVEKATNKLIAGCANSYIYEGVETIARRVFIYTGITTLELPSTLQTIGEQAFSWCESLVSLDLPAGLESIGGFAFSGCTNLAEITCRAEVPPTLGTDAFKQVTTTIPVYVPCANRDNYKAATGWSAFTNIDGYDCETILLPIAGYGDDPTTTEGWNLIASPLMYNVFPEDVENMTSNNYDLYAFDGLYEGAEWRNYKNNAVNEFNMLSSGVGYLYANSETVTLIFKGEPLSVNSYVKELTAYNTKFGHWNLIGNSFTTEATVSVTDYYRIEPGTRTLMPSSGNVNPMEGIFVEYNSTLDEVEFTKLTRGERAVESPMVNIDLRNAEGHLLDRARLRMGEGNNLGKLDMLSDPNRLYFRIDGKDYAVARVNGQGEMPLNFDAAQNGTFTLNVNVEGMELSYLHLIDNMTGEDIDLLAPNGGDARHCVSTYTFTGKPSDYASRFRLVFETGSSAEGDSFAFIDAAGNIVITNTEAGATLQVIDVTGRVVLSTDDARNVSTNGMTAGVYVLRLIDGDDVKVQKVVVR